MIKTGKTFGVATLAALAAIGLGACGTSHVSGASAPVASQTPQATRTPQTQAAQAPQATQAGVDPNAPETNPAGDIPDNQVFVPYTSASGKTTVSVPEGWARTDGGNAVTFSDKLNSVRIEFATRATAPGEADMRTEVSAIGATASGFTAGSVRTVARKAGSAIMADYRADAAADPVTGKVVNDDVQRYEFWHKGQVLTLTLAGPHGADNVDPWRIVTDSVRWNR